MKDIIYLGHTTMTHGLKGDLKFYSDFERKEILLNNNTKVLIDNEIHTITKCSYNKNYMLIIIDNLKDINLVEEYRNKDIYIKREELGLKEDEFLFQDLIDYKIICNEEYLGKVKDIRYNNNVLLYIEFDKNYYLPFIDQHILKVDLNEKKILVKDVKDLIIWKLIF